MPDHHSDPVGPRRPWSPYRKADQVVVSLEPEDTGTAPDTIAYQNTVPDRAPLPDLGDSGDDWDPIQKVVYLSSVEETELAETLILESRRGALDAEPVQGRSPAG